MAAIKIEKELSCDSSCFICLQQVIKINEDQISSVNFFLNYLKISCEIKAVCEKCGEILGKFLKLCNVLEKVRLEMDYLLGFIQEAIYNSKGLIPASGFNSVLRESVVKRCAEKIQLKPKVVLERVDVFELLKTKNQSLDSDCSEDWVPDWDGDESDLDKPEINSLKPIKKLKDVAKIPIRDKKSKKCPICSKTFANSRYLKLHNAAVHLGLKPFKCSLCPKGFSFDSTLRNHIKTVHKGQVKPNPSTTLLPSEGEDLGGAAEVKILNSELNLDDAGINRHGNSKSKRCPICSKTFANSRYLKRHNAAVHLGLKPFKCSKCSKEFSFGSALRNHIINVHKGQFLTVKHSMIDVKSERSPGTPEEIKPEIKLGVASTIPTKKTRRRVTCPTCFKTFSNSTYLKTHNEAVHLKLKPFKCSTCGKDFNQKRNMQDHIKRAHLHPKRKRLSKESLTCTICSKTFCNKQTLEAHNNAVHLGLKPFMCSSCPLTFTQASGLYRHVDVVHLNLKKFQCDLCGKFFGRENSLRRHKLTPHKPEGPKNFSCEICGKAFKTKREVNRHRKRVHNEKRFSCDICGTKFPQGSCLRLHISAVHEKIRHYCQVEGCDKSYANASALVMHYKLDHPDFTHKKPNSEEASLQS